MTERRKDSQTAERIEMALMTDRAFDRAAAMRYLALSGVPQSTAEAVLARRYGSVRKQTLAAHARPAADFFPGLKERSSD